MQKTEMSLDASVESSASRSKIGRNLVQMVVALLVLLMLANLPLNNSGFGLAQFMPDAAPIVIYDEMLLKGLGPEIYLLEGYKLRWIISPKASLRGTDLNQMQVVEDHFLDQFAQGPPVRHLIRCRDNPNIYALELEQDWIRVINTPLGINSGNQWDKVHMVSCDYLNRYTQGPPIN